MAVILKAPVEAPAFEPFADRVLVKWEKPDTTIELLDDTRFGNFAEVVAVGPGRMKPDGTVIPPAVKPGDKVLLPTDRPLEGVTLEGRNYVVVHEHALVGKVTK